MPLKIGSSDQTVSSNIRAEVHEYEKSGRIGTSRPANKEAAVKLAVAIALSKAGRRRKQTGAKPEARSR